MRIMAPFESQVQNDKAYQEHRVFPLLGTLIEFYNSTYMVGPDFITKGVVSGLLNTDHVVCASLAGTLDSVKVVLSAGRINDAYALVKKYHDGIIAGTYVNVYLEEKLFWNNRCIRLS